MFQNRENLLQLPFTQKLYQKTSRSVYDLIFIDSALSVLINWKFYKNKEKLEQAKLNLQRAKQSSVSDNEKLWINSLLNGMKVRVFFGKKTWEKALVLDKNYYYFWKSNNPVINLIVDSRDMIKVSKNMSL